ncbi:MAG: SMC-Scp complex subunit ScpB [Clostridia bacterium]|nr:SMC-Scp complex subunit ScpB [Clostridia bacterium]
MNNQEFSAAFEAVIFASGEPISIERLCQIFEISSEKVQEIAEDLSDKLEKGKRGIKLLKLQNTYQLSTEEKYAEYIKKTFEIKRRTPLSPAALEVLAVIAYNQPVTKSFIEQVRGVDCSSVVTNLVEKGLVEERGRLELPGRPLLYGTTKNFLRCFSISDLSELPAIQKDVPQVKELGEQLSLNDDEFSEKSNESETE